MSPVSRAHQGQDGIRRRLREKNAIAGLAFTSFAALEAHLARWMVGADERVHGTTHEQPRVRFERDERAALLPLPSTSVPVRERRIPRRVANDCFVDVDTVRYSVPFRLVRSTVEVLVDVHEVVIFDGRIEVARHRRHFEPHQRIADPRHFEGIFRTREETLAVTTSSIGRSLADYAACVGGAR